MTRPSGVESEQRVVMVSPRVRFGREKLGQRLKSMKMRSVMVGVLEEERESAGKGGRETVAVAVDARRRERRVKWR